MKVQVIRSKKQPPRFYVNLPLPLAAALGIEGARRCTGSCCTGPNCGSGDRTRGRRTRAKTRFSGPFRVFQQNQLYRSDPFAFVRNGLAPPLGERRAATRWRWNSGGARCATGPRRPRGRPTPAPPARPQPRRPHRSQQRHGRDVGHEDHGQHPREHAAEPSVGERRLRDARDVEQVVVPPHRALDANRPEGHGREHEHERVMDGDAARA